MSKTIICIDAGHGGKDPGAIGPSGLKEKDVTLAVALMLGRSLSKVPGIEVRYTRSDDRYIDLAERAQMANKMGAALFLSIHCNSAANAAARGFEVFTSPGQTAADPFATALFNSYRRVFTALPARSDMSDGDPDKEASFAVLRLTSMPAALFELDFISNPESESLLGDENIQRLMADALWDGIISHLRIDVFGEPISETPAPAPAPAPTQRSKKDRLLDAAAELVRLANEIDG